MWTLDTLGITDPEENASKAEIEKGTLAHFSSTVKLNSQGKFAFHKIVSLPLKKLLAFLESITVNDENAEE